MIINRWFKTTARIQLKICTVRKAIIWRSAFKTKINRLTDKMTHSKLTSVHQQGSSSLGPFLRKLCLKSLVNSLARCRISRSGKSKMNLRLSFTRRSNLQRLWSIIGQMCWHWADLNSISKKDSCPTNNEDHKATSKNATYRISSYRIEISTLMTVCPLKKTWQKNRHRRKHYSSLEA